MRRVLCMILAAVMLSATGCRKEEGTMSGGNPSNQEEHHSLFTTLKTSPITNQWKMSKRAPISTETSVAFEGAPGAQYNHHPQITQYQGRLIASWSSGLIHEDTAGQKMVMATSDDGGETWSAPTTIAPHTIGGFEDGIVTNGGIYVHEDTLVAYYGHYRYDEKNKALAEAYTGGSTNRPGESSIYTGILTSQDGGRTWKDTGERLEGLIPNLSPQKLSGGRLILPGHTTFWYTDDPAGITGWVRAGLPAENQSYPDSPFGLYAYSKEKGLDGLAFCEASCYQTADGTVQMMLRTIVDTNIAGPNPYVLAVTQSKDQGATWSEPLLTDFSDCGSKCQFGALPDGRFFAISCPQPASGRTPLVLSVSEDGITFDKQYTVGSRKEYKPRYPGRHKSGMYGYPTYYIDEAAGMLYVIYSLEKEDIELCSIRLSDIQ